MRTTSAKHPKGREPARTLWDDVRLLVGIARVGLHYLIAGHPIRRKWRALQRAGQKYYVDED
jgi:hypothetical protein